MFLFLFISSLFFIFRLMPAACLDLAASTIFQQFVTRLFTFLRDVIDEIQSKGISISRNVNELTENCLRQTNHRPIFFLFDAAIFMQSVYLLGLWWEWDWYARYSQWANNCYSIKTWEPHTQKNNQLMLINSLTLSNYDSNNYSSSKNI